MSCAPLSLYFLYLRCLVSLSYSAFCEWNRHFFGLKQRSFPKTFAREFSFLDRTKRRHVRRCCAWWYGEQKESGG